jgi:hypothetical protein
MKHQQKSGPLHICLAVLIVVATLVIAGCMESTPGQQGQMTATNDKQNENHAAGTTTTTGTMNAPKPPITAQPTPAPDPSSPSITIDPVGDKNLGDLLVISGTTNLPEKTWVYLSWTYGNSGEEKMVANKQVLPGTNGINHWRFAFDTSGFRPGSYNLTVATRKKDVAGSAQLSLKGTFLGTDNPVYYSGTSGSSGSAGIPSIAVQPPGDHQQGDIFLISGTTSLAEGTLLLCQVYPAYFEDKTKRPASSYGTPTSIAVDSIVVRDTGNANRWACALDTEGYEKTGYIVNVSTMSEDNTGTEISGSAQFTIR